MKVVFKNSILEGMNSVIDADSDTVVELDNTHIKHVYKDAFILTPNSSFSSLDSSVRSVSGSVIKERQVTTQDLLRILELPSDIDLDKLKQLLKSLSQEKPENRSKIIHDSFISNLSNYSTIATNLINLMNQFNIQF